jgi:hypothetical protein
MIKGMRAAARLFCSLIIIDASSVLPTQAAGKDDAVYSDLVRRVKNGDFTVDFRALRFACLKSDLCQPRGSKQDLGELQQATRDHQFQKVLEVAKKMIDEGFVNIEAQSAASGAYGELRDPGKAKFHLDVATALMRSILASGNGKTKATAFEVIVGREVEIALQILGLPTSTTSVRYPQNIIQDGAHRYV